MNIEISSENDKKDGDGTDRQYYEISSRIRVKDIKEVGSDE